MITITAECRQGHQQSFSLDPEMGMDYAVELAALMDGTSKFFLHPPGPESHLGKCSICRAQVMITVAEEDDDQTPPWAERSASSAPPVADTASEAFKRPSQMYGRGPTEGLAEEFKDQSFKRL